MDAIDESKASIYGWIKEREKHSGTKIEKFMALGPHFPDRPKVVSGDWVDIVVVTPESAYR